jgi:hypothetical protein
VKYNGCKNWNHWNVALWIGGNEDLYRLYQYHFSRRRVTKRQAAQNMLDDLHQMGIYKTPDGATYNVTTIMAAMRE